MDMLLNATTVPCSLIAPTPPKHVSVPQRRFSITTRSAQSYLPPSPHARLVNAAGQRLPRCGSYWTQHHTPYHRFTATPGRRRNNRMQLPVPPFIHAVVRTTPAALCTPQAAINAEQDSTRVNGRAATSSGRCYVVRYQQLDGHYLNTN